VPFSEAYFFNGEQILDYGNAFLCPDYAIYLPVDLLHEIGENSSSNVFFYCPSLKVLNLSRNLGFLIEFSRFTNERAIAELFAPADYFLIF
jgi:hypothetical protein